MGNLNFNPFKTVLVVSVFFGVSAFASLTELNKLKLETQHADGNWLESQHQIENQGLIDCNKNAEVWVCLVKQQFDLAIDVSHKNNILQSIELQTKARLNALLPDLVSGGEAAKVEVGSILRQLELLNSGSISEFNTALEKLNYMESQTRVAILQTPNQSEQVALLEKLAQLKQEKMAVLRQLDEEISSVITKLEQLPRRQQGSV